MQYSNSVEMRLSTDPHIASTIARYYVPAEQQDDAVVVARHTVRTNWHNDPDFIAALILRGRRNGGLAIYSQWRNPHNDVRSNALAGDRMLEHALDRWPLLDGRSFQVAFTRQANAVEGATLISKAATPFIHFGIFRVTEQNQPRLIERAEKEAPNAFGTPGLLAINFHRSTDGLQVLNLGAWSTFEDFSSLHQQPGFTPGEQYFQGLADFTANFFELADVIVGTSPRPEKQTECADQSKPNP